MAMRIYLPMRIDADIRIIRHSAIYADNADIDTDIRMAIPILNIK